MTNPFTAFAFKTSDAASVNRTLPARLADIKNVKDFGATGDGVTDDWAAIMAAVNWTTSSNRGLIYFPPGTYSVSQPIDFLDGGIPAHPIGTIFFRGEIGLSRIVGNFSDYVLRRATTDTAGGGPNTIEGMSVTNTNATGGGIRIGFTVGGAVRDCIVTANRGINTASDDSVVGVTSQELAIENCTLSPGSNPSGSLSIMSVSDGPIANCNIVGFSKGIICWGQQGGQSVIGCHIELCGTGVDNGISPDIRFVASITGTNMTVTQLLDTGGAIPVGSPLSGASIAANTNIQSQTSGTPGGAGVYVVSVSQTVSSEVMSAVSVPTNPGMRISGSHFKNCGTAINNRAGALQAFGIRIDAAEGTIAGDPQYGIIANSGACFFGGILVTGQYAQYAIDITIGGFANTQVFFVGVRAFNTSSLVRPAWAPMPGAGLANFINCNVPAVYTMQQLPAFPVGINTISWSGGTTTVNVFANIGQIAPPFQVTVEGVTPSGYNGTFTVLTSVVNTITYAQSNPGAPTGSGGSVLVLPPNSAQEGDCYNVSDSDVSTWGSNPVGGGSTHAKVRWSGSNWSLIGK